MAPALVRAPFQRAGWVYEEKVDGWRVIAYASLPIRTAWIDNSAGTGPRAR
jgi:hypothetical protein